MARLIRVSPALSERVHLFGQNWIVALLCQQHSIALIVDEETILIGFELKINVEFGFE